MNDETLIPVDIVAEGEETQESSSSPLPNLVSEEATQLYMTTCENVNLFIEDTTNKLDFCIGVIQFMLVVFTCLCVYKLFKLFFG